MKTIPILIILVISLLALDVFSQQEPDSVLVKVPVSVVRPRTPEVPVNEKPDIIFKTNGNMIQCKIIGVDDQQVNYKLSIKDTTSQYLSTSRGEVYAVAYGNGVAMMITPVLAGKESSIYPEAECEALEKFKKDLGRGAINVGIGFVSFYSPYKDMSSYDDEQVMPSVFAGYTFKIKSKIKAGAYLGIGGNELSKTEVSEYDQVKISTFIEEGFFNLGLYCRYDILDGSIKPYLKGGIDLIGINTTTSASMESLDGTKISADTKVQQSGIKPGLILRGGLDIYLGEKFGIYSDVGTGLSLVQVGILFSLE